MYFKNLLSETQKVLDEVSYQKPKKKITSSYFDMIMRKFVSSGSYECERSGQIVAVVYTPDNKAKEVLTKVGQYLAKDIGVRFGTVNDPVYGPNSNGQVETGIVLNSDNELILHPGTFDQSFDKFKGNTL